MSDTKKNETKKEMYARLLGEVKGLIEGEPDIIANLSNISALVYWALNDREDKITCNWCGFYFMKSNTKKTGTELVLGPFQGRIACIRIKVGAGVCGTCVSKNQVQIVKDVHDFEGHIACDSASNSEIVLPIVYKDKVIGVFDLDALVTGFYDQDDEEGLKPIVELLVNSFSGWDQFLSQ